MSTVADAAPGLKPGQTYNVLLAVNGLTATVIVDNKTSLSRHLRGPHRWTATPTA